jgi:hypothetical protein
MEQGFCGGSDEIFHQCRIVNFIDFVVGGNCVLIQRGVVGPRFCTPVM